MARLPRVLRALRPAPREVDPRAPLRVTVGGDDPHRAMYGSDLKGSWHPQAPHADLMVSVGGPGVHARSTPQLRQTVAEQIEAMIARNR